MTTIQSPIAGLTYPLPCHQLSPRDFERLCLWLVEPGGYERADGSFDQGSVPCCSSTR